MRDLSPKSLLYLAQNRLELWFIMDTSMKNINRLVFGGLLVMTMAVAVSCVHDPGPNCIEVDINAELSKVDATVGKSNGTITVVATGDSRFFTYSINGTDFQASNKFVGLDSGKYSVTVRNSAGCKRSSDISILKIDPCAAITLTTTSTSSAPGQSTGTITAMVSAGTGYTYSLNSGAFQNSNVFSSVASGNYTITAKNNSGCTFTSQVTVGTTNPCNSVTVAVTTTTVNPTLSQSNGSITAAATGATGFTYSINSGAFQTSPVFSGLAAGNYMITAKSSNGCLGTSQVTLNATNPCTNVTVVVTATSVNPTNNLSNGSITANATGGTGFTYSIDGTTFQAGGTFNNLAAGNYTITAKNSNGCIGTFQAALGATNPCAGITITVTATITGATIGLTNGSIVAAATGGTGFTFSLNNGAFQPTGTFQNLAAGNYTVTAKSADGCLGSSQFAVTSINPCAGVTVTVTGTVVNATTGQSNGSITASATGGSGFTYSVNGAAYQASGTFTGLAAGSYTVSAKNSNGCLGSATFVVGSTDPCVSIAIVVSTATTVSNNCVTPGTGSITVSATGSTGFTYNLNNGAYQASNVFNAVAPGTYTIGVKDVNNCTKTASAVVGTVPAGPTFTAAKILVQSRCGGSGCHMNGQTQKGYNFDTDCKIVQYWSGIYGSTVTHTLNTMPLSPQPPLTAAEKQIITDWINAGHGFGN